MDKLKNLLNQVAIIQKKYDELAEYSGEHYNVFDILGVTANELSHSAILTNLLNAKGKHGQKDLFLKIFLNLIKDKFEESVQKKIIENFDTNNSVAIKEKYAGKVDYEAEQGGKIDIVIFDGKNNIIIENKIYAGDQPKQLARYNQHDKNAPLIYLTLMGDEPSEESKGNLKSGSEYICVDYQNTIKEWLEMSIKEMANKPIIRETLNQYVHVIKTLTNQSINNKMSEDILKIMKTNISASFQIANNLNNLKKVLVEAFVEKLETNITTEYLIEVDKNIGQKDTSIYVFKKEWSNIKIAIYFNGHNFSNVILGIYDKNTIDKNLREEFQNKFKNVNLGKDLNYQNWYKLYEYNKFAPINTDEFWENITSDEFVSRIVDDLNIVFENVNNILILDN